MEATAEIAIAAALQLGALIWLLSGMKSDMKNLTGWLRSAANTAEVTKVELAELRGRVESLPCSYCSPKQR